MTEKEKLILSLLTEKPMAVKDIAEELDRSQSFVRSVIREVRDQIRVVSWRAAKNNVAPVYRAGRGIDAKKPKYIFPKDHWLSKGSRREIIRNSGDQVNFKRTEMDEWLFRARGCNGYF